MKILLRSVHWVIIISLFLLPLCSFAESAGSEPPKPNLTSAPVQAEEHTSSIAIKPDLRPSLFDNEESSTMMKWRMSSMDEKKKETHDPQAPEPLFSPTLTKAGMAQPNPFSVPGLRKEAISFPMPSG